MGVIAAFKADDNSSPLHTESFNLGPTGLRGWMQRGPANMGQEGLQANQDRQILITAVGAGNPATSGNYLITLNHSNFATIHAAAETVAS